MGCNVGKFILVELSGKKGVLVVDEDERLIGALNVHDLFRAGVM